MKLQKIENDLIIRNGSEKVLITAWGQGIRVRSVPYGEIPQNNWALEDVKNAAVSIEINGTDAIYSVGNIACEVKNGHLSFTSGGKVLLEEMEYPWALHDKARFYHNDVGSDGFEAKIRFKAQDEILHGMGQYRQARYNLKGCSLEMVQRNSQVSVPFLLSDAGYGLLWNNPACGHVFFAENATEWVADSTKCVDYWICAGNPKEVQSKYSEVTGLPSRLPDSYLGLWQCKLRYRTQDELMAVAREYHRRGIRLDVIVIDFFHWDVQGDWSFDPKYWPDPQAMVDELKSYGTKLMVSIWPTVDEKSKNFAEFRDNGYLVNTDRGMSYVFNFPDAQHVYDATNPEARKFAYNLIRKNYKKYGIETYWLDEAEPELEVYDMSNLRYYLGSGVQVSNIYPRLHAKMLWDGLKGDGQGDVLNLLRCAWVGSQKYGALVWSGDIESSFREMKVQLGNGLNMGIAGIPYWITDTAGFYDGNINDPVFKELLVRWFQWAAYLPVLRMHGDRLPVKDPIVPEGTSRGGGYMHSGADNEIWSFGEEVYTILKKYIDIREGMLPYIRQIADESEKTGLPMMRALLLEYPDDKECWKISDQYLFGSEYMVCPVSDYGARSREVYFPEGSWEAMDGSGVVTGPCRKEVAAPLDYMPVFKKTLKTLVY